MLDSCSRQVSWSKPICANGLNGEELSLIRILVKHDHGYVLFLGGQSYAGFSNRGPLSDGFKGTPPGGIGPQF